MNRETFFDKCQRFAIALPSGGERRYLRVFVVCELLGWHQSASFRLAKYGGVEAIRVSVPVTRRNPRGMHAYYSLDQLPEIWAFHSRRFHRDWTQEELDQLYRTVGVLGVEECAKQLGRTPTAVRELMSRRHVSQEFCREQYNRLIGMRALAKLLGKSSSGIRWWVRRGCPAMQPTKGRREFVFNLAEVRQWLRGRYSTAVLVSPRSLSLLHLKLDNGRVVDARKEREAA